MSNPQDISRDPADRSGWASFSFPGNGTVGGQVNAVPAVVTFLERGYYNIVHTGRDGTRYPIDSSVYKRITFKMSANAGSLPAVYWFQTLKGDPGFPQGNCAVPGATNARCGVMFVDALSTGGWQIFTADTTKPPGAGGSFSSQPVMSLRIDPTLNQPNQPMFFDWVRITRADTDPLHANMPITFTGGPASNIEVSEGGVFDARGVTYDVKAQHCPTGASPCNFNYGVLPPGTYTLRVVTRTATSTATFTINNPPLVKVTDPDESHPSGADFATTVLGNTWDMNDPADVVAVDNINNTGFGGGIFSGNNTNGDPMVILLNSSTAAIDTTKYRYLTYRYQVDGPFDFDNGWVTRVFWSPTVNPLASQVSGTKDIVVYPGEFPGVPGYLSYTVDLGSLTLANGGIEPIDPLNPTGSAQQSWADVNPARLFRFDPFEERVITNKAFHLDSVFLRALTQASAGSTFTLKYAAVDGDGTATSTVALYYAANKTGPKTLIASGLPIPVPPATVGTYPWLINGVPPGIYWIYAEATDTSPDNGPDVQGMWSTGQIAITGPSVPGAPTIGTASATGPGTASVTFGAPTNNGGAAITSYTATCTPATGVPAVTGNGKGSPIAVSGLINGINYTCTVHATNSAGDGPKSAPSNAFATSAGSTLSVTIGGTGTGTVVGAGIVCPGDCAETYPVPAPVLLTAAATNGSVFTGWLGGGCTGNATLCTVNVSGVTSVSATFAPPGTVARLDIDLSAPQTPYSAVSDGMLVLRYLYGLTGNSLVAGAIEKGAQRSAAATIKTYLDNIRPILDVDGNSMVDAPTDGLMILRRMFGLQGTQMTNGAIGAGATRDATSIQRHIDSMMP